MAEPGQEETTSEERQGRGIVLTEKQRKARRHRSIALGLVLAALVIVFYAITIVRMGGGFMERPI